MLPYVDVIGISDVLINKTLIMVIFTFSTFCILALFGVIPFHGLDFESLIHTPRYHCCTVFRAFHQQGHELEPRRSYILLNLDIVRIAQYYEWYWNS